MRQLLIILVVLILLAAVANLVLAIRATNIEPSRTNGSRTWHFDGPAAGGWPAPTPMPWPTPTTRQVSEVFAARETDVRVVEALRSTHSMRFEEFGWPLPVLQRVQMWWPWEDPRWKSSSPSESGLTFRWSGFILNPLMVASFVWIVVVLPVPLWRGLQRRRRRLGGRCVQCAHPLLDAAICPECGFAVAGRAALAGGSA